MSHRDLDMLADADPGVGALDAIDPEQVEVAILVAKAQGDRRGASLSGDLDDIALGNAELAEHPRRNASSAAAEVVRTRATYLEADGPAGERHGHGAVRPPALPTRPRACCRCRARSPSRR